MLYQIIFTEPAERMLEKLPADVLPLVEAAIDGLAVNPRPPGCLKMKGYRRRYRIRVGKYRVQYDIFDRELIVEIVDADHRRDAYR